MYYNFENRKTDIQKTYVSFSTASSHPKSGLTMKSWTKVVLKISIADVYELSGEEVTTNVADRIKDIGFEFAMRSGATIAVDDITIPAEKAEILGKSQVEVESVNKAFRTIVEL